DNGVVERYEVAAASIPWGPHLKHFGSDTRTFFPGALLPRRSIFAAASAPALTQLFPHRIGRNARLDEQHQEMIDEVGAFHDQTFVVPAFACDEHFGGFLAYLLEDFIDPLREKVGRVGTFLGPGFARGDDLVEVF